MNPINHTLLTVLIRLQRRFGLADQRGQTSAEYLGVIVLVAAVVAAVATTDIGGTIAGAISRKINDIVSH